MKKRVAGVLKRKNKYNNRKVRIGKWLFDSGREADRYRMLKRELRQGLIADLQIKPRYSIEVNGVKICSYTPDFKYRRDGVEVVEDAKGYRTREYRLKRKLMRAVFGVEIQES